MDTANDKFPLLYLFAGLGMAAILPSLERQEKRRRLEAFQELNTKNMTAWEIWQAAMEYNKDNNKRLRDAEALCALGEYSIEAAQGLRYAARLERNPNVPRWVALELLKDWGPRFVIVHGFDLKFADQIKQDCETSLRKVKPHPNDAHWQWVMMRAKSRQ